MLDVGVSAATDVTGFGLLGHAFEMADGSGMTIEIDTAAVPLMALAYELGKQGILTRAHKASRAYIGARLAADGADDTLVNILADAQTSGGLLISVPEARANQLLAALTQRGTPCAAIIGRVHPRGDHIMVMR
jgi:selenide,water dikinase